MGNNEAEQKIISDVQQELVESVISGGIMGGYLDEGFPFYYINQKMLDYLGYVDQEEFVTDIEGLVTNCMHPDDRAYVDAECEKQLGVKGSYELEYRMRKKDGGYIWVHDTGKEITAANGKEAIISICYDITEKKEQGDFLQNFIDSMNGSMGTYQVEQNGRLIPLYVSNTMGRMIGMPKDDYIENCDRDAMDCIHPEDKERLTKAIRESIDEDKPGAISFRSVTASGKYTWLNASYSRSADVDGIPTIRVVFTPASAQFEMQQDMIHNMPGGVCLYKWDGIQLVPMIISDQFVSLYGGDSDNQKEKISAIDFEYVHPDDMEGYKEFIRTIFREPEKERFHSFRFWNRLEDAYVWIGVNTTDIVQADGTQLIYAIYSNVDQIKKAEEQIRRSEQMLEQTCSFAGVWTFFYDIEKRIVYPGKTLQQTFHLAEEERNFPECMLNTPYIPEKSAQAYREMVQRVNAGEDNFKTDIQIVDANDEMHWLRYEWKIIEYANETPKIALGYARSVDEEKLLEARIRMEQKRLMGGDGALLAYIVSNISENKIVEHKTFLGEKPIADTTLSLEEGSNRMALSIIDLDKRQEFLKYHECRTLIKMYSDGRDTITLEYRRKKEDDTIAWERNVLNVLRHPETGSLFLYEYCYDINKEKLLEETMTAAVNYNFERFGSINLSADQISMLIPNPGTNDYKLKTAHYTSLCKEYAVTHVLEEDRAFFLHNVLPEQLAKNLEETGSFEFNHRELGEDGEIHYKQDRHAYYDKEKKICLLTRSDVTDMVRAEEEKQRSLQIALQKEKNAAKAKSDFLSRMSHELRTPLNAIAGYTTLLEQNAKQEDPLRTEDLEHLKSIQSANKYLLAIIGDILDVQKMEAGHIELVKERINSAEYMNNIVRMIKPEADQKKISFSYEKATEICEFYSLDGVRLQQVLLNLLHNAIKFTPQDGKVRLQAESIDQEQNKVMLRFTISDTGIGMSEEYMEHELFKAFSQENHDMTSPYEGTGIGLCISRQLARLMDGDIVCESKKGKGTTFVVTVLADREEVMRRERRREKNKISYDLNGKRILICEDNLMNQDMTKRLLLRMNCQVEVADDGAIGVDKFKHSEPGYFDIILMDLRMPVMDGFEATKEIRSLKREDAQEIPIVALSANAFEEDVKMSLAAGMNEHLAKPAGAGMLYEKIRQYCIA